MLKRYATDENGAVTVDWVVLTAALVGLGLAVMTVVSGGVEDLSGDINGQLVSQEISASFGDGLPSIGDWSGQNASDYLAQGQSLAPGNNGAAYHWATQYAGADAPAGFNFDNPLSDPATGHVVYTSDDGRFYAAGGQVYSVDDYPGTPQYYGA